MTQNRRIVLNIVATYGRSAYGAVLGLFTARWVLMSLGQVDYGLFGVVGGLTVFISVINNLLGHVVGRYYALSIGKHEAARNDDSLEECRRWFSMAVGIHTVVPFILMVIGYPIGEFAVRHWLVIPADRIESCVWVFRFVCISCFICMVNVPFTAMYTAKQYIAELTLYSFASSTLNACFLYFMVTHPGDWLFGYALWGCVLSIAPQIIITCRAVVVFPECRFRLGYCFQWKQLSRFLHFVGWQTFGVLGGTLRGQCIAIVINKYFGPRVNAAMSVANSVNGHANSLSSAMINAFTPAIVSARGSGDLLRMRTLAYGASKFGMLLALIFMIPLGLELPIILKLWLKNPPAYSMGLCLCFMLSMVIDKSSVGQMVAVNSQDKIALYQAVLGTALILTVPLAWLFAALGLGVYSVGIAYVIMTVVCAWGRVWFARSLAGMSARYWLSKIMMPIVIVSSASICSGLIVRRLMREGCPRIFVTAIVSEIVLCLLSWGIVLRRDERAVVLQRIAGVLAKWGII